MCALANDLPNRLAPGSGHRLVLLVRTTRSGARWEAYNLHHVCQLHPLGSNNRWGHSRQDEQPLGSQSVTIYLETIHSGWGECFVVGWKSVTALDRRYGERPRTLLQQNVYDSVRESKLFLVRRGSPGKRGRVT